MNPSRREQIVKDHPLLFNHCKYFDCGDGWLDLIEDLADQLEFILEKQKDSMAPFESYCTQVKEKFGTLRFYMSCETDEMTDLIEQAELLSGGTCEICGQIGELRREAGFWYQTLCEKHID